MRHFVLLLALAAAIHIALAQPAADSRRRRTLSIYVTDIQENRNVIRKEIPVLTYSRDDSERPPTKVRSGGNAQLSVAAQGRVDVFWNMLRWATLKEAGSEDPWKHGTSLWCQARELDGAFLCEMSPIELVCLEMDVRYGAADRPVLIYGPLHRFSGPNRFTTITDTQQSERQILYEARSDFWIRHWSTAVVGNELLLFWEEKNETFQHRFKSKVRWARGSLKDIWDGRLVSGKTLASDAYEPRLAAVQGRDVYGTYIEVKAGKVRFKLIELGEGRWQELGSPAEGELAWARLGTAGLRVVFVYALREDCLIDKFGGTALFHTARYRFYTKANGFGVEKKLHMDPVAISNDVQILGMGDTEEDRGHPPFPGNTLLIELRSGSDGVLEVLEVLEAGGSGGWRFWTPTNSRTQVPGFGCLAP